jgi:hypothetical protein
MDEVLTICRKDPLATNRLGEIAIAKVLLRALEKGVAVLRPVIECRYDLVLDDGLKLYRTQVKYAGGSSPKQCRGVVQVGLRKWDLLLVYVRRIDRILWFGPEVFDGRAQLFIRVEPTRNHQVKGCLMAADYIW